MRKPICKVGRTMELTLGVSLLMIAMLISLAVAVRALISRRFRALVLALVVLTLGVILFLVAMRAGGRLAGHQKDLL